MEQAENEKQLAGVKVLGGGCDKCNQLEKATVEALIKLGMDTTIEHVRMYLKAILPEQRQNLKSDIPKPDIRLL